MHQNSSINRIKSIENFHMTYSRAGSVTAGLLVFFGSTLDYFLYPASFTQFFIVRFIVAFFIFTIYVLLKSKIGLRYIKILTFLWLITPQAMICWMISYTNGPTSIYFVGLLLAIFAIGIFLPVTFIEGVSFGTLTLIMYLLACYVCDDTLKNLPLILGNSSFILLYIIASAVTTYFNQMQRNKLFELQDMIQSKNESLEATNNNLTQIKGHMIQQEKMSALGTLSAGLLHEVNNPVNYSMMALNMALDEPLIKQNPSIQETLNDSKDGMLRVQAIVGDLKTFAYQKPGDSGDRLFLFEKALTSAIRLSSAETKGIDIRIDLPQDTHVRGDEPGVIGVLINLITNAALALRKAEQARPILQVTARHGDLHRLFVTVRDNGTGIKPENLDRIFEPFFTTRDVGQGLGLGLAVSYAVIKRHNSILKVSSELGAWTEFAFDLPTIDSVEPLGEMIKTFEFNAALPVANGAPGHSFGFTSKA